MKKPHPSTLLKRENIQLKDTIKGLEKELIESRKREADAVKKNAELAEVISDKFSKILDVRSTVCGMLGIATNLQRTLPEYDCDVMLTMLLKLRGMVENGQEGVVIEIEEII